MYEVSRTEKKTPDEVSRMGEGYFARCLENAERHHHLRLRIAAAVKACVEAKTNDEKDAAAEEFVYAIRPYMPEC